MKIDINPNVERATGLDLIAIDVMGHDYLYVVRTANGEDFTVKFKEKDFNEFQPNKTVSEMMEIWEQGLVNQLEVAKRVVETNEHPTWTQPVYENVEYNGRVVKKKIIGEKPYKLSSTTNFQLTVERISKQLGKMTFVKLVGSKELIDNQLVLSL